MMKTSTFLYPKRFEKERFILNRIATAITLSATAIVSLHIFPMAPPSHPVERAASEAEDFTEEGRPRRRIAGGGRFS